MIQNFWSERRGSNPLPSPWQGDALPDELLSHKLSVIGKASTANKTFTKISNYYNSKKVKRSQENILNIYQILCKTRKSMSKGRTFLITLLNKENIKKNMSESSVSLTQKLENLRISGKSIKFNIIC